VAFSWRDLYRRANADSVWANKLEGIDMSGRRPLIKGYFAVLRLIVGAVMSSACRCGSCHPLALMLSADPLPQSRYRA
jgi:hypothetical protein